MKIMMRLSILLIMAVVSGAENNPVLMGSSYSGGMLLRGIDAVRNNPANLALSDNVSGSLSCILLPNVSCSVENSFPLYIYNDYFAETGDNVWSAADKRDILDHLGDRWRMQNNICFDIFSISVENTAVSFSANSVESISIPKDFLDLALNGNETGKKYDAGELDGEMFNSVSVGVSYAQKIEAEWIKKYFEEFSVGGTLRFIHSIPGTEMDDFEEGSENKIKPAYMKINNISSYVVANDITGENSQTAGSTVVKGSFEVLISEAGLGFGTDLGMSGVINDRMRVGLSFSNLFSYINWYKNNKAYVYSYVLDGLTLGDLEGSENDSLFTENEYAEKRDFTTVLPPEMRLDYLWLFINSDNNIFWTSSYIQGFYNELNTTTIPKFSTGIEWFHNSADWLKLRSGISAGGEALFSSAAGFSIKIKKYVLDLAVENKYWFGESSKGLSFALGQKFVW